MPAREGVALACEGGREGEQADRREDVEAQEHRAVPDDHEGHEHKAAGEERGRPCRGPGRENQPERGERGRDEHAEPGGTLRPDIDDEAEGDRPAEHDGGAGPRRLLPDLWAHRPIFRSFPEALNGSAANATFPRRRRHFLATDFAASAHGSVRPDQEAPLVSLLAAV